MKNKRVAWNKGIPNPMLAERNRSSKMRRAVSKSMKLKNPMKKHETILKVSGENNHRWMGDEVGYSGIHKWIKSKLGKAERCSFDEGHIGRKYSWANVSGSYLRDVNDWTTLCWECHNQYDIIRRGYKTARGRSVVFHD